MIDMLIAFNVRKWSLDPATYREKSSKNFLFERRFWPIDSKLTDFLFSDYSFTQIIFIS